MCLELLLLCPRCEQPIQGIDCLISCLLKLRDPSSICDTKKAWRFMTSTEMTLTAISCTNLRCAMNVAQQLIYQLGIWHAVDIMDEKQMEESQAQAPTPWADRAVIRKFDKGTVTAAPVPLVAGLTNSSEQPAARAPMIRTPANMLLHQALSYRRRRTQEFRVLRKDIAPDRRASIWDEEISNALGSERNMFVPSDEIGDTEHDSRRRAAHADEYMVFIASTPAQVLRPLSWSHARDAF